MIFEPGLGIYNIEGVDFRAWAGVAEGLEPAACPENRRSCALRRKTACLQSARNGIARRLHARQGRKVCLPYRRVGLPLQYAAARHCEQ